MHVGAVAAVSPRDSRSANRPADPAATAATRPPHLATRRGRHLGQPPLSFRRRAPPVQPSGERNHLGREAAQPRRRDRWRPSIRPQSSCWPATRFTRTRDAPRSSPTPRLRSPRRLISVSSAAVVPRLPEATFLELEPGGQRTAVEVAPHGPVGNGRRTSTATSRVPSTSESHPMRCSSSRAAAWPLGV